MYRHNYLLLCCVERANAVAHAANSMLLAPGRGEDSPSEMASHFSALHVALLSMEAVYDEMETRGMYERPSSRNFARDKRAVIETLWQRYKEQPPGA